MLKKYVDSKELMKVHNIIGLSVALIKNGQIQSIENEGLMEAGTDKIVHNNSVFNACSISKFLTALVALKLTEEDRLDLDEDINKGLRSWKIPTSNLAGEKKMTLRNLLIHQSGVVDPEGSFTELIPETGFPSMSEILNGSTPYCKTPIQIQYEPESDFHYSDAGFCIIQQLIEDVTGGPFEKTVEELIFEPLQMTNSTFLQTEETVENFVSGHNKDGTAVNGKFPVYPYPAASGLWTTSSDLSKLLIELMDALNNKSRIGISAANAHEMISEQGSKSWTGLGVFLDGSNKELQISSLGWGVGFQSMMLAYPQLGSGLIIMTNTDSGVHQLKGIIGEIYHSLKPWLTSTHDKGSETYE
ncbi:serine hydrolase domain-containing protein [Jeotgalibacillus proteolyticus]|uniref:Penicillin-binding protein n=1 Tax=Jeotgalibacillus proteolyticus TaxID=2082395 RepID=A0A2S5G9E5_9BACL|nr:serine hydrolase domain-containing protein [Jeotgalibacillus proteolyticus]PPA69544.1 penicillin-binding protein [Jeotgalibacillus proteolyticus]